jgi:DNA-binding IclR family transcriptional regulator
VKNDGFARNFGESEIDICGYASAIRDRFGAVRASIALTGPVRLKRIKEADIVTALKAACDTVGRALP